MVDGSAYIALVQTDADIFILNLNSEMVTHLVQVKTSTAWTMCHRMVAVEESLEAEKKNASAQKKLQLEIF
eukprot:CAMPEP_0170548216 /NCGR_PEP_ID=MMETSP0211-20121228/6545_1 /TAXON_ID=311385 /ORGANISM="Pseudokeronopsis sp., Strain OXSARD2" /LENGTH=70 /DNA_ID=CAMNT_0010853639 /DNA_START=601 /DNA_END=810 /DNA_ORIENTATION=-